MPSAAQAGPAGGTVTGGSAVIENSGAVTTVTQTSERGIIKWNGFDVGRNESVRFAQPSSSSITVNRIAGGKPSEIDGSLSANGRIVLINPDGVVFGATSRVDVGGLIATTSDIGDDAAFLAGGAMQFTQPGNPGASVVNRGSITVGQAGLAGLVAPNVENSGTINATMGKVALASGDVHYIDFAGDGLISVAVSDRVAAQSVKNSGTVEADGGSILVTAAQARQMVDAVVANTGTLRADTRGGKTGSVTVSSTGTDNATFPGRGTVTVGGTVSARGAEAGDTGGAIAVLGNKITLAPDAKLDASGDAGGGTINVGGAYQGGDALPAATTVDVKDGAILNADAGRTGDGGSIVVWSDGSTAFAGSASARGGTLTGDGGMTEISGHGTLDFTGTADLRADNGATGTLLLDPTNITISSAASQSITGTTTVAPNADNATSILNVTTLQNQLATSNVKVQTRTTGSQAGDITVADAVTWTSPNTLTLATSNNIIINAPITGKNLTLQAGNDLNLTAAVSGAGTLTIQPLNGQSMGIGTGQAGALSLNDTEMGLLSGGWSSIVLGSSSWHGQMNIGARNWASNLTLISSTAAPIHINGAQNLGTHNLKITTDSDLDIDAALSGSGSIIIGTITNATTMGVAGEAGTLNLSVSELNKIVNGGWESLSLGNSGSTQTLKIGAYAGWRERTLFYSGTGGIDFTGTQNFNNNSADIVASANVTIGANLNNLNYLWLIQSSSTGTLGIGSGAGDYQIDQTELSRLGINNVLKIGYSNSSYAALNIADASFGNYIMRANNVGDINLAGTISSAYGGAPTTRIMSFETTQDGIVGGNLTFAAGTAILPGTGGARFYSLSPLLDTYNGYARATKIYNRRNNSAYTDPGGAGDLFLYGVAPSLTLTANPVSREYGDANPALSYTVTGLIDGDSIGNALSSPGLTTAATASSNVGAYSINANPVASAMGYTIASATGNTLTVTKAHLSATADDQSRAYGDPNPALTVTYAGFKNGEDASVIDTLATASTAANATTPAGTAAINVGGAGDNNYDFSYYSGLLTINKATLTATADNQSRAYGDPNPPLTVTYTGFKNGEDAGVIDTLATATTAAGLHANAGSYPIIAGGGFDNNYDFHYIDGVLSVGQAPVTVIPDSLVIALHQLPVFTVSYFGLKFGEDSSIFTTQPSFTTTAPNYGTAGDYILTAFGAAAENYTFSYQTGTFGITARNRNAVPARRGPNGVTDTARTSDKPEKPVPVSKITQVITAVNSPIKVERDIALYYGFIHPSP